MSTAIETNSFLRSFENRGNQEPTRIAFYTTGETFGEESEPEIRFVPVTRKRIQAENKPKSRVLRRMNGLLMGIQGKIARVTIIEGDQTFHYDMPAERLTNNGINIENQPFQMDEVEIQMDDGLVVGYQFRALAKEADAYVETLTFDEERKTKLGLILKKFAKAKT